MCCVGRFFTHLTFRYIIEGIRQRMYSKSKTVLLHPDSILDPNTHSTLLYSRVRLLPKFQHNTLPTQQQMCSKSDTIWFLSFWRLYCYSVRSLVVGSIWMRYKLESHSFSSDYSKQFKEWNVRIFLRIKFPSLMHRSGMFCISLSSFLSRQRLFFDISKPIQCSFRLLEFDACLIPIADMRGNDIVLLFDLK